MSSSLYVSLTHRVGSQGPARPALLSPDHVGDVLVRILPALGAHAVPAVPQDVPGEVVGLATTQSSPTPPGRAQAAPYQDDKHLKRKQSGMFVRHFLPFVITCNIISNLNLLILSWTILKLLLATDL